MAEQLAEKKYLLSLLNDLKCEKNALDYYLRHHTPSQAEELLSSHPEYRDLLSSQFKPVQASHLEWMQSTYPTNNNFPQNKIHKTCSGNTVRSKSEALIDMVLSLHQIPFRYECALTLGETTIYPDFTILHPRTEQIYYWEHFGKMDNFAYAKNVSGKLNLYLCNNIIPTINLITTYETSDNPLDTDTVEKIVTEYFQ